MYIVLGKMEQIAILENIINVKNNVERIFNTSTSSERISQKLTSAHVGQLYRIEDVTSNTYCMKLKLARKNFLQVSSLTTASL